jgi:hypothetical protein
LTKCADCGTAISGSAEACPTCGAKVKDGWRTADKIAGVAVVISVLTLVLGLGGAWVAYGQFSVANATFQTQDNWKRREFVLAQIKDFYADPIDNNVLTMLDYDPARVELYPEKTNPAERTKDIPFSQFVKAIREEHLQGDTLIVRQQFEHFLRSLRRFNYLIRYDAVSPEELCADFEYPLSLLAGDDAAVKRKRVNSKIDIAQLAQAMAKYVDAWGDTPIREFIRVMSRACGFRAPYLANRP